MNEEILFEDLLDLQENGYTATESLAAQVQNAAHRSAMDNPEAKSINLSITTKIQNNDKPKVSLGGEFVMAFVDNLITLDLTPNEFKIMAYVLKWMEFGNLIGLSQKKVGEDLNISKSNVSRIYKSLEQKDIFVKVEGHLFVNSNIFCKGLAHKLDKEKRDKLIACRKETSNIKTMYK